MNYLSVCSGICTATVAWKPLGWKPAAFSEIDQKPCAVLRHHYPDVPIHGDFTTIKGDEYGAIDLIVGGTPCQDFSVAGLRSGFAGDRGNLTLEFVRLIDRIRPKWVVWENVPGVLSIDEGRAFGTFLEGLAECGYGFSYRVLDAQYFGVPQRRRRVFVVGYLGDWRPAAAVLFERESLCGDITPRREAGESVAPTISARTKGGGGLGTDFDLDGGLIANCVTTREGSRMDPSIETYITHSLRGEGFDASEDGTGRGVPIIPIAPILSPTLDGRSGRSGESSFATSGGLVAFDCKASGSHGFGTGDIAPTLRSMSGERANGGGQIAVAAFQQNQIGELRLGEVVGTLNQNSNASGRNTAMVLNKTCVRRLTPRECERLMGLPNDYTLVPLPLKKRQTRVRYMSDSARYKMIGNSFVREKLEWLGQRIELVNNLMTEMKNDNL